MKKCGKKDYVKLSRRQLLIVALGLRAVEHRNFDLESEAIEIEQILEVDKLKSGEICKMLEDFKVDIKK